MTQKRSHSANKRKGQRADGEHAGQPRAAQSRTANFRLINGLIEAAEQQLRASKILSFTQLAAISPANLAELLADVPGITEQRILEQDWLGQARELAAKFETQTGRSSNRAQQLESEGFAVDLFLDEAKGVRKTQVLHVKSGEGEEWDGWQANRLLAFMRDKAALPHTQELLSEEHAAQITLTQLRRFQEELAHEITTLLTAGKKLELRLNKERDFHAWLSCNGETVAIRVPATLLAELGTDTIADFTQAVFQRMTSAASGKSKAAPATESAPKSETKLQPVAEGQGAPPPLLLPEQALGSLHAVEIIPAHAQTASRLLKGSEPFAVRLTLHLDDELSLLDSALNYTAAISAQSWETQRRHSLRTSSGTLANKDKTILVDIPPQLLPPGKYQLEVQLETRAKAHSANLAPITATLKSGLVQVY